MSHCNCKFNLCIKVSICSTNRPTNLRYHYAAQAEAQALVPSLLPWPFAIASSPALALLLLS